MAHPSLFEEPHYLHSQPTSHHSFSKVSRHCEVSVYPGTPFDTVWIVHAKDSSMRVEMEGQPVPAHEEVILLHGSTRQCLESQAALQNQYGREFEVCGHTGLVLNKTAVMKAELVGKTTPDVPAR
eukprot:TRINITY_DN9819_c0_g1_i5.p1 TRINITY_DN9819_c0_g1~~TRINITY_DN9819_c0_g1_i5.p1  ORF type:complete len:125 (-),score=22.23 TRINITY_DN9819_c0_g1_i5:74-448(-)